jgi:protease-4
LWFLATGLRVDLLDPATGAPSPYDAPQQWLRWGMAVNLGDQLAVGSTLGWSFSRAGALDDHFSMTTALTWRPTTWLSTAVVARDWNEPESAVGRTLGRSWDFGVALRPVSGRRGLEIGLETGYRERPNEWVPRATVGVDVPRVGRLRGEVSVLDPVRNPQWMAMAGLDINYGGLQAGGGGVFGSALGGGGSGFYATAALRAFREPGIRPASRYVKIRIENTPGVRRHTRLLRRLWEIAEDPTVSGVVLVVRAEPASSLAHAEEVGDALRGLRVRGKKVLCHLEDAGGRSLHVCSQADRIAMNPAGGLRFAGLASSYFYYGGLLQKLGVRADFVRIAEHKLAAEQFTRSEGSPIAQEDHRSLLENIEALYMHDVGGGRKIPLRVLRQSISKGPFLASEARASNLIDVLAYEDEIDRVVEEMAGGPARVTEESPLTRAPTWWGAPSKVAIVYLHGDMVDGESTDIPFVGIKLAGSYTVARALRRAREDSTVKAVVFRVETGGGSSLAADVILREAILTARAKPFVVSMGTSAASGGYYAAVGGGTIFANRGTITGSIGIFYGKVDVVGLLDKLGVGIDMFRTAPKADAESFYRPFTDEERRELGVKVKQFYDLFVARVAEGRRMTPDAVDAVGRGRVWTGAQAIDKGLVDRLGGLREALEEARKLGAVPHDAPIVELPEDDESLLGTLAKLTGLAAVPQGSLAGIVIPPALLDVARALTPFMVFDGTKPLARSELVGEISFGGPGSQVDESAP